MRWVLKLGQSVLRAIVRVASAIEDEMNGWAATQRLRQRGALVTVETSERALRGFRRSQKELKGLNEWMCVFVFVGVRVCKSGCASRDSFHTGDTERCLWRLTRFFVPRFSALKRVPWYRHQTNNETINRMVQKKNYNARMFPNYSNVSLSFTFLIK